MDESRHRARAWIPDVLIALTAVGCSLAIWPVATPRLGNDSLEYLKFADTLQAFHVIPADRPDRLPGYPVFLLGVRALAWVMGLNALSMTALIQVLMLAGLVPLLVYDLTTRTTGYRPAGLLAAPLIGFDLALQRVATNIMTEALGVALAVLALWFRVKDGSWRRGSWALAALSLTKPYLAPLPFVFGAIEAAHARRPWPIVSTAGPTVLLVGAWLGVVVAAGGSPRDDAARISALADFVVVYDARLWTDDMDPDARAIVEDAARRRVNGYGAAQALTKGLAPWNPPADWRPLRSIADQAIRAHPWRYVRARLAVVPRAYNGGDRRVAGVVPPRLVAWQNGYRRALYGSLAVFVGLLAAAMWRGLGWPKAVPTMRHVLVPYVAVVFGTVAALSVGTYEVGRLAIVFHPVAAILWASLAAHALRVLRVPP